ncbi:MAG: hypothetical protein MUF48_24895, partial [Pirellulaceae bacterium]|nr:hypothetical protein [Pirellulaceae bacterium]
MFRARICGIALALLAVFAITAHGAIITNVVESGGYNDVDTIPAKWTGQTWTITAANKPFTGAAVGNQYTVLPFGSGVPAFVDRNHRYFDDTPNNLPVPAYLSGLEYIMSGNDNRENANYR